MSLNLIGYLIGMTSRLFTTDRAVVQAYLALPHLRDTGKARAWLCGIITNICRTILRRQAVQPLSLEAVLGGVAGDSHDLIGTAPDPQQVAEHHE